MTLESTWHFPFRGRTGGLAFFMFKSLDLLLFGCFELIMPPRCRSVAWLVLLWCFCCFFVVFGCAALGLHMICDYRHPAVWFLSVRSAAVRFFTGDNQEGER